MSDKIREAFEKFAATHHELKWYDPDDWDTDAGYGSVFLQLAYETWQAALAQQPALVAQEPVAWVCTARKPGITEQRSLWHGEQGADTWLAHFVGRGCEVTKTPLHTAPPAAEQPDTVAAPRELLAEAESIIDSYAESLKASHAPGGDWEGEEAAQDDYEREAGVAAKLRALLAGGAA